MIVIGCDVETTGLNAETDKIIELGACIYCFERKKPLAMLSYTIDLNEPLSDEIKAITGITQEELEPPLSTPISSALYDFLGMCDYPKATHLMAHNAPFDKAFLMNAISRAGFGMPELPWIDTCTDVPYPDHITTRKLTYLAPEHGFIVNHAHRALFDTLAMCKIASFYPFEEIAKLAASPNVRIEGRQKFQDNQLVKERGFRWDGEAKKWFKNVKECNLEKEIASYDFPYKVLGSSEGN